MINNYLFKSIDKVSQGVLLKNKIILKLSKGEPLFHEGEKAYYVYYVKEGNIKVYKTSIDGNETIFNIYKEDSFVAAGVLFKTEKVYPAGAKSVSDSVVYALLVNMLEIAIVENSESARQWMSYISNRLITVQSLLSDQIFADGLQRLKKLLRYFYANYPSIQQNKYIRIEIPVTKQEMAELLNIRRETLSRMLSALKEENICECNYKEIIVKKDWLLDYQEKR